MSLWNIPICSVCGQSMGTSKDHTICYDRARSTAPSARVIKTVDEFAGFPDGTVVRNEDGLIGEKRDMPFDFGVRYIDGSYLANNAVPVPVTILYVPGEEQSA